MLRNQGLSIVHAVIVEKHGGHKSVKGEVGLGNTFILNLPLNTGGSHA
jgi:signal transduction histidine kinase